VDLSGHRSAIRSSSAGRRRTERSSSGLQLAFGVDQEITGCDDLLMLCQAFEYDEVIASSGSESDLLRFKIAIALIEKNELPCARL
jgi:hypothetical protein